VPAATAASVLMSRVMAFAPLNECRIPRSQAAIGRARAAAGEPPPMTMTMTS
jgi:hypothetical protein